MNTPIKTPEYHPKESASVGSAKDFCAILETVDRETLLSMLRVALEALERVVKADEAAVKELEKLGISEVDSSLIVQTKEALTNITALIP